MSSLDCNRRESGSRSDPRTQGRPESHSRPQAPGTRFVVTLETVTAETEVGGKARALAALDGAGFPVPAWFALTPDAFRASTTAGGDGDLPADLAPSPEVREEIDRALAALCPNGESVAVRSSATDEDGVERSFAGQLDSFLFVSPADVADRVARVWRSAFGERVRAYRQQAGLDGPPQPPAVLVQRMVDSEASGVAFGADPVTGRRGVAVVSAVRGLGTGLVSGECDADTFSVGRDGSVLETAVADKAAAHERDASALEGVRSVPVAPELASLPAVDEARVREIAAVVWRAGAVFGRPQDMEWAVEGPTLYVLQSRPITSLAGVADPDGAFGLWDNSNIAESYPGVTTPLTFSFARRAYEEVYRQFCRMMGVPEDVVAENATTFRRMIGLVRGRIYYDLLNWHRVLATLPGYNTNRRFMEQMMGVKEPLPEGVDLGVAPVGRARDAARLARTLVGLVANCALLERRKRAFAERLDGALGPGKVGVELSAMRADELVTYYRNLERRLLAHWDAPLVNDFFAMIFYGVLRGLVRSWCGDAEGTLQNDLLCGGGGMISAEPAERVFEMARVAARDPGLAAVLTAGSAVEIEAALRDAPELARLYEEYLDKFGDRCLEELKLESPTLRDDPIVLLRSIGSLAGVSGAADAWTRNAAGISGDSDPRSRAERRVRRALSGRPVHRALFAWVLANARARVRDRENLRFERTRVFGRVRAIFVELGKRLCAEGALADPRDVFYLDVEEVLGWVEGTTTCANLGALAEVRRGEFEGYRAGEPPADRFETRGAVHAGNSFRGTLAASEGAGEERRGLGCSPGVVRGRARVVTDPRAAVVEPGEILVAERTDPGWVVLFAPAAGILVERGSLLSHAAIVAREMGIPAATSVPGLLGWLETGDVVELDGTTGTVRRVGRGGSGAGVER
jgi:rifampicin phosphotransferase